MFNGAIVGALRRRCFPTGETTGRLIAARHRNKFLGRTVTPPPWLQCCKNTMFRHDTAEFYLHMFGIALSAHCADVVFPWENNRAANSRPYERYEITPAVIRWHPPANHGIRRGGYYPPANVANLWAEPLHPHRGSNVANVPCFDMISPNFICKMFDIALSAHCADVVSPQGETTGRLIAAPTQTYRIVPGAYFARV